MQQPLLSRVRWPACATLGAGFAAEGQYTVEL